MKSKWTYPRLSALLSDTFVDDKHLRLEPGHPLNAPSSDLPPYADYNPNVGHIASIPELREWRKGKKKGLQKYTAELLKQDTNTAERSKWEKQLEKIDLLIKRTWEALRIHDDRIDELRATLQKHPAVFEPYGGVKRASLSEVLRNLQEEIKGLLPRSLQDQMEDMPENLQDKIRDLFPKGEAAAAEIAPGAWPVLNVLMSLKNQIIRRAKIEALYMRLVRCKYWLEYKLSVLEEEERYFEKHGEVRRISVGEGSLHQYALDIGKALHDYREEHGRYPIQGNTLTKTNFKNWAAQFVPVGPSRVYDALVYANCWPVTKKGSSAGVRAAMQKAEKYYLKHLE